MSDDLAGIARSLTKAQREALLATKSDEPRPYSDVNGQMRVHLFGKGLFRAVNSSNLMFGLTPLGLALRTYLLEQDNG